MEISRFILPFLASLLLNATGIGFSTAASVDELQLINVSQLITSIGGDPRTVRIDDISSDGAVVIGRFSDFSKTPGRQVFRYTKSNGMEKIMDLSNISIDTLRISDDGEVIWGAKYDLTIGTTSGVFRWTRAGGFQQLAALKRKSTSVQVASNKGDFIAGSFLLSSKGSYHAFRYSESGGFEDLGPMQGDSAFANGISSDGQLVLGHVQFNDKKTSRAFLHSKTEGIFDIGTYAGNWTSATGISSDGSIIVGNYCAGGFSYFTACTRSPFVYTKKSGIKAIPKFFGKLIAGPKVSPDGKIMAGGYIDSKYESYIFVGIINSD